MDTLKIILKWKESTHTNQMFTVISYISSVSIQRNFCVNSWQKTGLHFIDDISVQNPYCLPLGFQWLLMALGTCTYSATLHRLFSRTFACLQRHKMTSWLMSSNMWVYLQYQKFDIWLGYAYKNFILYNVWYMLLNGKYHRI